MIASSWSVDKTAHGLQHTNTLMMLQLQLSRQLGTWFAECGEGEDVVGVHTLLFGVVQVCHELLVGEEEEKEKEQGRQEEREVKGESQSEENTRTWMTMWLV